VGKPAIPTTRPAKLFLTHPGPLGGLDGCGFADFASSHLIVENVPF
jgi:hypothetical protein